MAKRRAGTKKAKQATDGQNGGVVALTKELFQAAITLRDAYDVRSRCVRDNGSVYVTM